MNDLSAPLGFKDPGNDKRKPPFGTIAALSVVSILAALIVWLVVVNDPLGGQPVALVKIENVDMTVDKNEIATVGVKSSTGELLPPATADDPAKTGDGTTPPEGGVDIHTVDGSLADVKLPVDPDPDLVERIAYGPLPRIGEDGRRPVDVYARPVPSFVGASPKIVIIVGDLGLSQNGTQAALQQLPPQVTLAFAPYGASLDRWTQKARQDGHELLLQVPLEPFDYPDNDPGENTLLTTNTADKNLDDLHFFMTKITTYVGIINYMGGRFTADPNSMDSLMGEVATRGLMYVDDSSSARSLADQAAAKRQTPFAKADVVIDAIPVPNEIGGRLAQLEQIARTRGLAIGVASGRPVTIKEVSSWAKTLDARGITIVPITAALQKAG
ncbi:divergent polysaccharide deacetylase family protein [Oryzibacter oryziterrae]|uniref:divergent polysaccharide deacetylase family protein n=1 Tax=Oryzibacter oryziterrae TaxID=2766474 RepID=UPI001F384704|nr:divergent polysaccharide deacetylase family protein [Oryzibacter oryziterrae]